VLIKPLASNSVNQDGLILKFVASIVDPPTTNIYKRIFINNKNLLL
jgi:hypothetical protein